MPSVTYPASASGTNEQGFTLVELLIVIIILGVIGTFTMTSLVQGMQTSQEADNRISALTDLQRAGDRMTRELRMACTVETSAADQVAVDVLRDGQRYRYTFDVDANGDLLADVDTVADDGTATDVRVETLSSDIVNGDAMFAYRDGAGAATTIRSEVRDISVTLRRAVNDDVVEWTADMHLRNGGVSCGF